MRRQRGFTLLELLVVLAIAGLMTGLTVAWLDTGRTGADRALQRLAEQTLTQAALARHAGQVRGLRWTGKRPEFVRREAGSWVVEALDFGDWPVGLRPDWPAAGQPQLLFTAHGWAQPGSVHWRWAGGSQRWAWDRDGRLHVALGR